ncbi:hypothetical protein RAH32_19870 [Paracoccus sp. WLY502]|uniref:hypothetical protein n=1 Tax=Paracoccus yibinensis TaxID=3068891 RepID=UPI002796D1E8|nr:hypothetical protein [Paracoccus sp. WLY502]MDQ1902684.1 hypothetical protein [Paracoccus sp. WLY502]
MHDLLASTYTRADDLGCNALADVQDFGRPIQGQDLIPVAARETGFLLILNLIRSVPL